MRKIEMGAALALPLLAGCGFAYGTGAGVYVEEGYVEGPVYERAHPGGPPYAAHRGRAGALRLPVPRGHLPPPGRCRIWLPGVPPGHQPPPGSCRALERRVPPGAWLLVRSRHDPRLIEIIAYDARRPIRVRYLYHVRTGRRLNPY